MSNRDLLGRGSGNNCMFRQNFVLYIGKSLGRGLRFFRQMSALPLRLVVSFAAVL